MTDKIDSYQQFVSIPPSVMTACHSFTVLRRLQYHIHAARGLTCSFEWNFCSSRETCVQATSMAALKRKRGGQRPADKESKKVKFVADEGETPVELENEAKNEVTVPPPVSQVSTLVCY